MIVQLKQSRPRDPLLIKEADVGDVEAADEMDPAPGVRLFVDAANVWTELALGGRGEARYTYIAEPGLGAGRARVARDRPRLLDAVTRLVNGDSAPVTLHDLVGVVTIGAQTHTTHLPDSRTTTFW